MFRLHARLTVNIVYLVSNNVSTTEIHVCYYIVVCSVSNLVQFRHNVCLCLLDNGSEDIQVLPNGLAFITSVSFGGRLS